jgi:hypothetical protein
MFELCGHEGHMGSGRFRKMFVHSVPPAAVGAARLSCERVLQFLTDRARNDRGGALLGDVEVETRAGNERAAALAGHRLAWAGELVRWQVDALGLHRASKGCETAGNWH